MSCLLHLHPSTQSDLIRLDDQIEFFFFLLTQYALE